MQENIQTTRRRSRSWPSPCLCKEYKSCAKKRWAGPQKKQAKETAYEVHGSYSILFKAGATGSLRKAKTLEDTNCQEEKWSCKWWPQDAQESMHRGSSRKRKPSCGRPSISRDESAGKLQLGATTSTPLPVFPNRRRHKVRREAKAAMVL